MTISPVPKPSFKSAASVDSLIIIEAAHETGTQAVIRSPHLDRLTPCVSRRGRRCVLHHRMTTKKLKKKRAIRYIKMNHSQYQYCKIFKKIKSE